MARSRNKRKGTSISSPPSKLVIKETRLELYLCPTLPTAEASARTRSHHLSGNHHQVRATTSTESLDRVNKLSMRHDLVVRVQEDDTLEQMQ